MGLRLAGGGRIGDLKQVKKAGNPPAFDQPNGLSTASVGVGLNVFKRESRNTR